MKTSLTLIIIITLFSARIIHCQDLNLKETLKYLNDKFQEFPRRHDLTVSYYKFSVTEHGELEIEETTLMYSPIDGQLGPLGKSLYRIDINLIDIEESFHKRRFHDRDNAIYLFPKYGGTFLYERNFRSGKSYTKETIPYESRGTYGPRRNYISIYLADVGNKHRYNNALLHLINLVLDSPDDYKKKIDPFDRPKF